jgi:hypothetical protein
MQGNVIMSNRKQIDAEMKSVTLHQTRTDQAAKQQLLMHPRLMQTCLAEAAMKEDAKVTEG